MLIVTEGRSSAISNLLIASLLPLESFGHHGRENKSRNQANVLDKGIGSGKAGIPLHCPEIVSHHCRQPSKDAEQTCAQPNQSAGNDNRRAYQLNSYRQDGPEGSGIHSEMLLLGYRPLKVEELDQPSD